MLKRLIEIERRKKQKELKEKEKQERRKRLETEMGEDAERELQEEEEEEEEESLPGCTLFIKNLNFDTTEETLKGVSDFLAQREWVGAGLPVC